MLNNNLLIFIRNELQKKHALGVAEVDLEVEEGMLDNQKASN